MPTVTLTFRWKISDVLTDATSVRLSDSTGAFGVKRTDTDAVIVADATVMTHASTGVYTYTFTGDASVEYAWVAEVLYLGTTYRFESSETETTIVAPGGTSLIWRLTFENAPTGTPTLGIIRTDTGGSVVAPGTAFVGSGISWSYTQTGAVPGVTYRATWTATKSTGGTISDQWEKTASGSAVGEIIDQQDIVDFLGTVSLEILSQQDSELLTIDAANVQRAIDKAEDRVKSILGNGFVLPLTVNGTALRDASTASVGREQVIAAACQYASFLLNKWRAVQGLSGDGRLSQAAIDNLAKAWESDADTTLRGMVRWAQGYDDGLLVDIDVLPTSVRADDNLGSVTGPYIVTPTCLPLCPPICWPGW